MPRSSAQTTARIRDAASRLFAESGFERTTVRAVAAEAGVDPALVMRYFGSKEALFAAVAELHLDLPEMADLDDEELVRAVVDRFFTVWEDDDAFRVLLRASATSEVAAQRMREVFTREGVPRLRAAAYDHPETRATLVGSQMIGFAFARYVLKVEPLASMDEDAVRRWLGPAVLGHLRRPLPES